MSMVICPECGSTVSQYAESCVKCGFPISKYMKENNIDDVTKILFCPKCGEFHFEINGYIVSHPIIKCKNCNIPLIQSDMAYEEFMLEGKSYSEKYEGLPIHQIVAIHTKDFIDKRSPGTFDPELHEKIRVEREAKIVSNIKAKNYQSQNAIQEQTPRCPKCGSTSITAGQKGYSLLTGFLGSNKTVNRCANCGHTWKPGR